MSNPSQLKERLSLPHMATSPDLVGFRTNFSPHIDTIFDNKTGEIGKPKATALLESLIQRSNEEYKTIAFKTTTKENAKYQKRVSFDTINSQVADDDPLLDFSDDDLYSPTRRLPNDMEFRGRGRDRELMPMRSPGTSPGTSPNRMLSPIRGVDIVRLLQSQVKYPTTPIIIRRGCTFTRVHKSFEDLYLGNLRSLCPVLPGRVILVYISGRQHTWVALDWILRSFIEHGDTVIVVTAINHALGQRMTRYSNYTSPSRYQAQTSRVRQRQRRRPEYIKEIAANVMRYAMKVVNPAVIAKITVEICEGTTKEVLKDMYKLYEPNIVSTGSKVNARNSAPLKSWLSSRLSDRLVKNFSLPVIVVPALNMAFFERELKEQIEGGLSASTSMLGTPSTSASTTMSRSESKKVGELTASSSMKIISDDNEDHQDSLSDESLHSVSSAASVSSADSYNSFEEIAELYGDYRRDLHKKLHKLTSDKWDDQYFVNFLKTISDMSLLFCEELRSVDPDFRGQGAKLARAITGSTSFGAVPFKTKSLLIPLEEDKPASAPSGGISYEELKRNLKRNALRSNEDFNGPIILIDPPSGNTSPTTAPKPTALKFSEGPKPMRRKNTAPLKKFLSHEDRTAARVNLEPSKSHPDIRTVMSSDSDSKKKKKKKKFWKLF